MNPIHSRASAAEVARAATSVVELLELLWEGGREAASVAPVSPSQLRVLFILEHQQGINLRTLSDALDSTPPSVSRLCDRLQAVGFIERAPSANSRRELELRLTGPGRLFLADLRSRREAEMSRILAVMPAAQRQSLLDGMRAFRTAAVSVGADGRQNNTDAGRRTA
jgi:DNA-binding MarR family transcriptional regulator